jgi:hypothetical protein
MRFFAGDGRPDLLSDWYAFGDGRLLDARLLANTLTLVRHDETAR